MTTCPNGHQSTDPEWCDTCGERLGAPATPTPVPAPAAGTAAGPASGSAPGTPVATVDCPNCGFANIADSLFCEDCGYDFTTGQDPPSPRGSGPAPTTPAAGSTTSIPPAGAPSGPPPIPVPPTEWSLRVEVDATWFALKGELADEPCPPASSSVVPLATNTALVGRTSQSRNVHPEVALDGDPGVSRRHAQLVSDGSGWTIADLGSTNGTYVVSGGAAPSDETTAIPPHTATELHIDDHIFVGAWTRLTLLHQPPAALDTLTNGI